MTTPWHREDSRHPDAVGPDLVDPARLPPHDDVDWRTDTASLDAHRFDRSGWTPDVRPAVVASVRGVAGVQHVARHAHRTGTPLVARGAGTGLTGAATAVDGGIVLDLTGLNRVVDILPADELALVEPGVLTADLDRAAARHGLRYAPDPASVEISTIGGNIATNAGGLRCAKYGVTRDAVLGLDVVLADGRLIHTGRRAIKGVTGYDLTSLFVGSEGTLGVIVGATLRLRPIPVATATLSGYFPDAEAAFAAVGAVRAAGIVPAVAEFIDGPTLERIDEHLGTDLRARGAAFVLLQTDGAAAEQEAATAAGVLRGRATSLEVTTDPAEAARLTAVRRAALPALERVGRVLIEDIGVPRSRLPEAVAAVRDAAAATGTSIHTFAHAADGNLHPIIVLSAEQELTDPDVQAAADAVFRAALRLGGTVSGEHGVGALKRRWMRAELGEDVDALQRQIKDVFDPTGILNPGKAV
ncbi:FAD-binding protein [Frankia sp. CNm7]|uniref:FAD-binding protein n=1 Tax=Frankia nepalensis TaxID=1836974 RepID=A0A937RTP7_9ACTN|nr:FAD-linked oxidase C-terminal domain-containing protein [Frankia nepalensis]MBL7502559.1 FAD-binding protein [Frankia nepalensis]MBL7516342.1 FAD-binding protein [Frankia nepalensis]MBL7519734.1 FAD-binding protein [Frankia nepalensis]MBL7633159.1 FAD-binding protein [Frankia nepalensis]